MSCSTHLSTLVPVLTPLLPPPPPMPSQPFYYSVAAVLTTISSPCHCYTLPPLVPGHISHLHTPCQQPGCYINFIIYFYLNNLSNVVLTIWCACAHTPTHHAMTASFLHLFLYIFLFKLSIKCYFDYMASSFFRG